MGASNIYIYIYIELRHTRYLVSLTINIITGVYNEQYSLPEADDYVHMSREV